MVKIQGYEGRIDFGPDFGALSKVSRILWKDETGQRIVMQTAHLALAGCRASIHR